MKVRVDTVWESGRCDDCGPYDIAVMGVYKDDVLIDTFRYNDHLGADFDINDPKQVLEKVMGALGIQLEINDTYIRDDE